jgi:hypothetical protein
VGLGKLATSLHDRQFGMAHFYVRADDAPTAGSHLHTMCARHGLVFKDFVYLPDEEKQETVHLLDEHRVAFELAMSEGEALVLTVVMGHTQQSVDLTDK